MESRLIGNHLTRRQFVRLAMAAGLGAALTSCGGQEIPTPEETAPTVPAPTSDHAYLAVARGAEPRAITRAALAAVGGIERDVLVA